MLNLILLLLSVTVPFGIIFRTGINTWWAVAMIPGTYVALVILYFFFVWVATWFLPKKEPKKTSAFCRFMVWLTMDWLMQVARIRIRLTGKEILPDCPCVLVSNHRSDFDPMTVLAVMRGRKLAYISKEGNFHIPLVGPFIRGAGFLSIDRNNGMRAIRTLKAASDRMLDEGFDVGIYPEGTRSRNGKMLRFKEGAFYIAKQSKAPIVIMSTKGTEEIPHRAPFRRTNVELDLLEVIDAATVEALSMEELAKKCRSVIAEHLGYDLSAE